MLNLESIANETVDGLTKGLPPGMAPLPLAAIGLQDWNLLRGDLPFPSAVSRDVALAHNHAAVQQLAVCVRFGVRRVLMANQLLGSSAAGEVVRLRETYPDLEFHFLVDSKAQLRLVEAEARQQTMTRRLTALLELGIPGGRTGCRTAAEALALARAIAASSVVDLAGIECYEGLQVT